LWKFFRNDWWREIPGRFFPAGIFLVVRLLRWREKSLQRCDDRSLFSRGAPVADQVPVIDLVRPDKEAERIRRIIRKKITEQFFSVQEKLMEKYCENIFNMIN
jgi:hypothetical protein